MEGLRLHSTSFQGAMKGNEFSFWGIQIVMEMTFIMVRVNER